MVKQFLAILFIGIASFCIGISLAYVVPREKAPPITITNYTQPSKQFNITEHALRGAVLITIPLKKYINGTMDAVRGTGVHVNNNIFLSAKHVCDSMPKAIEDPGNTVTDYKGITYKIISFELSKDPIDLCIFKVEAPKPSVWPSSLVSVEAIVGEQVYTGGFSGGRAYSFRAGICNSEEMESTYNIGGSKDKNKPEQFFYLYELGISKVRGGASGSGVLNTKGEIIGILTLSDGDTCAAMRAVDIVNFLKHTRLGKEVGY